MKLQPLLVNPEFQDPILMVAIPQKPELVLFDLGYCFRLKLRDIKRISRIFISHTHIDHFAGFDHVLRLSVDLDKTISVYGPPGIIGNVAGKLSGYVWNLKEGVHINFCVYEVTPEGVYCKEFLGRQGFVNSGPAEIVRESGGHLCRTEDYWVDSVFLDHRMPVLAYRITAVPSYNADLSALRVMGLEPGKWVGELKARASEDPQPDEIIEIEGNGYPVLELVGRLVKKSPGTSIAYVVDTIYSAHTSGVLRDFLRGTDILFSESAYLSSEEHLARENYHLTAAQAAMIARDGEVGKLIPFHFSRRYEGEYYRIYDEARSIFPLVAKADRYGNG